MKLQIVELPDQVIDDQVETPYLLVFSEVEDPETLLTEVGGIGMRESTGARGVLAFEDPVEVLPRATQ